MRDYRRTIERKPLALDLFSGCGGLTTGLKKAGFRVVGAVELNPLAVQTYKMNHPEVHVWQQNINRVVAAKLGRQIKLATGRLDLLAGCPPCQAFSRMRTLNRRHRVRDPKQKDLLYQLLRFVRVLEPKAVMVENVPGLATDHRWKRFVSALRRLGYDCEYKVLNCADYSVPQRRRRLILLGSRTGPVSFARPARRRVPIDRLLKQLGPVGKSGDELHDFPEKRSPRILRLIKMIPRNGGSRLDLGFKKQLPCHRRCDGFKDIYGRMKWGEVAPTITTGCFNPSKGRFLHPRANRAITLREAAILQSFPKRYRFDMSEGKCAVASMIGNALPPEFVRRHALMVRRHLALSSQNKKETKSKRAA
jgi:DNA (cytosine-5)-methyltransferase 1